MVQSFSDKLADTMTLLIPDVQPVVSAGVVTYRNRAPFQLTSSPGLARDTHLSY